MEGGELTHVLDLGGGVNLFERGCLFEKIRHISRKPTRLKAQIDRPETANVLGLVTIHFQKGTVQMYFVREKQHTGDEGDHWTAQI